MIIEGSDCPLIGLESFLAKEILTNYKVYADINKTVFYGIHKTN